MSTNRTESVGEVTSGNRYIFDPESPVELESGSLLNESHRRPQLSASAQNLDLACGPGGWVLDTAFAAMKILFILLRQVTSSKKYQGKIIVGEQLCVPAHLELHTVFHRWQGEYLFPQGGALFVWIDTVTFYDYVAKHLKAQGIEAPTPEQRGAAIEECCQFSHWQDIQGTCDGVHVQRLGLAVFWQGGENSDTKREISL